MARGGKRGGAAVAKRKRAPARKFVSPEARAEYDFLRKTGKLVSVYTLSTDEVIEKGLSGVRAKLDLQCCSSLLTLKEPSFFEETCEFYANLAVGDAGSLTTIVGGKKISLNPWKINEYIGCPYSSLEDCYPIKADGPLNIYNSGTWPIHADPPLIDPLPLSERYFERDGVHLGHPDTYRLDGLTLEERILFEFIGRTVIPSAGHVTEPTIALIMMFYYFVSDRKINPGYAIIQHMKFVAEAKRDQKKLPYGNLITLILKKEINYNFVTEEKLWKFYDKQFFARRRMIVHNGRWIRKPYEDTGLNKNPLEGMFESDIIKLCGKF